MRNPLSSLPQEQRERVKQAVKTRVIVRVGDAGPAIAYAMFLYRALVVFVTMIWAIAIAIAIVGLTTDQTQPWVGNAVAIGCLCGGGGQAIRAVALRRFADRNRAMLAGPALLCEMEGHR
jgi:hypothetical protein